MKTALLFPGQGAQAVGMGKDLYERLAPARNLFDRAEEILGLPLKKLCFEGPEEQLARTDICQPAIFTMSVAALECLRASAGAAATAPAFTAGLSLGEYTALYAAGAMDFETGLKLVARRGAAMQQAATAVPSGMVSLIGLDEAQAQQLCAEAAGGEVLTCANFNCPGQIVISGALAACKRAEELAPKFGAKGAVPLKVAGAFHSAIMAPAAAALDEALGGVNFSDPNVLVISNVDAQPVARAADIRPKLVAQLTSSVRWQQSVEYLLEQHVEKFYEIGPGKVLSGLMRRINRRADIACVNSLETIEKLPQ